MGGKRVSKEYMTHDEFMKQCKGKSAEEVAVLEAQFWKSHGINPEVDFYPPEERAARFDTVVRAALGMGSRNQAEEDLRNQIRKDWGLHETGS